MSDTPTPFAFPDLPDEAIIALNDFLERVTTDFQNRYCAQIYRYYQDRPTPDRFDEPRPLSPDDPPF